MSFRKSKPSNDKLHRRRAGLVKREKITGSRFDKLEDEHLRRRADGVPDSKRAIATLRRAKLRWEAFWDELADWKDEMWAAPILDKRDLNEKLAIAFYWG